MGGGGGRDTGVGEGGLPWLVGWLVVVDVRGRMCMCMCIYIYSSSPAVQRAPVSLFRLLPVSSSLSFPLLVSPLKSSQVRLRDLGCNQGGEQDMDCLSELCSRAKVGKCSTIIYDG